MTADQTVERAAAKLQQLANQFAGEGGLKSKLAQPLAEDADLIRKMKPSLIKARAKGEAPTNQKPGRPVVAPSSPQIGGSRPKAKKKSKADEVQPVPGWGRKEFFRDLKKAVRPLDEPRKKKRG